MFLKRRFLIGAILLFLFISSAFAASTFRIRQIRIQGLRSITTATVFHYLPVHIGQRLTPAASTNTIQTLYGTGFFSNVSLFRQGNTLIVRVKERPVIGLIQITGNKKITTDKLRKALKKVGMREGDFYSAAKLSQVRGALQAQYQMMGYYTAKVSANIKQEPRNRVALYIHVKEGGIAKIKSIRFEGNHAFSQRKLREQMQLTTSGILTWFTKHDRYSEIQLKRDLASIHNFYLDHGYYDFQVVNKSVKMTDDNQRVAIVIRVSEGAIYHISGWQVISHYSHKQAVLPLVTLREGEVFSRAKILAINNDIAKFFADRGYAFPQINAVPKVDSQKHLIFLKIMVNPRQRMYVRHIVFRGNYITHDTVLRARLRQMEGGLYNLTNINESKRQLALLRYISPNMKVQPKKIPGKPDQMDLIYHVKEVKAGRIGVQGGYSDTLGFLYGANLSMPNFLGSGRTVNVGFQNSQLQQYYSFGYNNPLYTLDGVDRSFKIYFSRINPGKVTNISGFSQNDVGAALGYGIPLSNHLAYSLGLGFDHIWVGNANNSDTAQQVVDYVMNHPTPVNQIQLNTGASFNSLNRAILPTKGLLASFKMTYGVPAASSSLNFFVVTLHGDWYIPITHGFILFPHTLLGYGTGFGSTATLPFYDNFYAGGINTLPGFEPNSLGPVVLYRSGTLQGRPTGQAIGGNVELLGGVNLIFPNPISKKVRTSVFFDAGNVFQTQRFANTITEDVAFRNLRYSTGLMVTWWTPLGWPVSFSLAKAFNVKTTDQTAIFGFSFGANI